MGRGGVGGSECYGQDVLNYDISIELVNHFHRFLLCWRVLGINFILCNQGFIYSPVRNFRNVYLLILSKDHIERARGFKNEYMEK